MADIQCGELQSLGKRGGGNQVVTGADPGMGPAVLAHERRCPPSHLFADIEPLHAAEQAHDFAALRRAHPPDSSGIIGGDLRMLTALYARACRAAPPDPKKLAAWLVTSRLDGPGWPDIELADFADSWAAIGVKFLRQQLAALSGDVDAHVAVLAENLHGARQYGEIVMVLRDAGRGTDAERWARRGLAEGPASYWADGLREQLAGLLLASGRGEEAVCVHRAEFERRTLHQDYFRLREALDTSWSAYR